MGSVLGLLFVDPATLPGGLSCVNPNSSAPLCPDTWKGVCQLSSGELQYENVDDVLHFYSDESGPYCSNKVGGFLQLITLCVVYGAVLLRCSDLISDGSELLMFVPKLKGVVGSVVLPIMGVVPDSAMVLFSGLGNDAQRQLSTGMGALAGSTVMLLTLMAMLNLSMLITWFVRTQCLGSTRT